MTTINLTDAQRDTFAACGLIVIDGERPGHSARLPDGRTVEAIDMTWAEPAPDDPPDGLPVNVTMLVGGNVETVRVWLSDTAMLEAFQRDQPATVAPEGWRILTEPCDTCGGEGSYPDPCGPFRIACRAPDCVGGLRVVTLTATCPRCLGKNIAIVAVPRTGRRADGYLAIDDCPECDDGVVTLGRFTIPALLPVVEFFGGQPAARVNTAGPLIYLATKGPSPQGAETVEWAGGPLPRPGQFIARPERVE